MSSFIFNSELPRRWQGEPGANPAGWRRFALTTLFAIVALSAAALLLLAVVDPYDTGRFSLMPDIGLNDAAPRTANASRGRNRNFNAAIVGNSRGQLVDPSRLSAATGLSFVQLTVPGTGPLEAFTIMRWYLRHHPKPAALAVFIDQTWCSPDPALPVWNEFPFWLYADGKIEYLKGLVRSQSFGRLVRRLRLLAGQIERTDPVGYWDYHREMQAKRDPTLFEQPFVQVNDAVPADAPLPAVDRLRDTLAAVPDMPLLIVFPPAYSNSLPRPGSIGAARLDRCKAAFTAVAAARPHSRSIDMFVDSPIARNRDYFLDPVHYTHPVARLIEEAMVAKFQELR